MNNITIDLEYNFNNLRNMIQFNCGKMYDMSSKFWVDKGTGPVDGILKDDKNWWVHIVTNKLDSIMESLSHGRSSLLILQHFTCPLRLLCH